MGGKDVTGEETIKDAKEGGDGHRGKPVRTTSEAATRDAKMWAIGGGEDPCPCGELPWMAPRVCSIEVRLYNVESLRNLILPDFIN
jgi:hypothetical protein